jgi:hypothetical protein
MIYKLKIKPFCHQLLTSIVRIEGPVLFLLQFFDPLLPPTLTKEGLSHIEGLGSNSDIALRIRYIGIPGRSCRYNQIAIYRIQAMFYLAIPLLCTHTVNCRKYPA